MVRSFCAPTLAQKTRKDGAPPALVVQAKSKAKPMVRSFCAPTLAQKTRKDGAPSALVVQARSKASATCQPMAELGDEDHCEN